MEIDFSKCHCDQPGFCSLYKKVMTEIPPNWQWCKDATPEKREQHYNQSLKRQQNNLNKDLVQIVSNQRLYEATGKIIPYIQEQKIDGIVGIPRSGMIPASLLSVLTSLPLYSIQKDKLVLLGFESDFGGSRMTRYSKNPSNLLFIDDTCYSGKAAKKIKDTFGTDIKIAVVFSTSVGLSHINFSSEILEPPHFLEWNFFNCLFATESMFDIDGLFCPNVPVEIAIDEQKYINFITNVKPYFHRIPKLFKASKIVTARLEKYRSITEQWLKKHDFNYNELVMFPTQRQQERDQNHVIVIGQYKAQVFNSSYKERFFIESEVSEANIIKSLTDKAVMCPSPIFN